MLSDLPGNLCKSLAGVLFHLVACTIEGFGIDLGTFLLDDKPFLTVCPCLQLGGETDGMRPSRDVVNVFFNIFFLLYMFYGITHIVIFFLYLISFAYACESKKRGFTLHISVGSPINRRVSGRDPTLHRYSQRCHKWRQTVNPWGSKSPKGERSLYREFSNRKYA